MENLERNQSNAEIIEEDEEGRQLHRSVTIIAAVCTILFCIVGVVGNIVTVIALSKCTRLRRHATTVFVINLSISDLIFSVVNLPLMTTRYLNEAWILGDTFCRIYTFFFHGNVMVSLLSMVAITINRYMLIVKSDIYERFYTSQGITLMLIAIWVLSFSFLIPPLLGVWGTLGLEPVSFSCTILEKNGKNPRTLLYIVGFAVPCVIIIISYLGIYFKLRNSRKKLEAHSGGRKNGDVQKREEVIVTKRMLILFTCFLLCFLPVMLLKVFDQKVRIPILHVVLAVVSSASNVIYPFIYVVTNKLYRKAYMKVLCPRLEKNRVLAKTLESGLNRKLGIEDTTENSNPS